MIYSIQQIRAFAAILVVMTHVVNALPPVPGSPFPVNLDEVNIVFTFAAGFLFRHLSLREPYRAFMARRVVNVLVPYALISIPALLIYVVGDKQHGHVDLSGVPDLLLPVYLLLTGLHLGALWFVPMIFVIYAATPVIRGIDGAGWRYAVAIPISLLLGVTILTRPEVNANPPLAAAHYLPVFLIGMCCARYNAAIGALSRRVSVWAPALAILIALVPVSAAVPDAAQYPLKLVMLLCLFVVASRTAGFRAPAIDLLAKYSFGIFFLHGYFIAALRIFAARGDLTLQASVANVLALTALICLACVLVIRGVKLVGGRHSRLLVGA